MTTARENRDRWSVDVTIMPKAGVNDPQGDSVEHGLHALGFTEAGDVRVGKVISLTIAATDASDAETRAAAMCDRLLANPVIESYGITVRGRVTTQSETAVI
jgi:phosphoribosylformylglycinamidine synthase